MSAERITRRPSIHWLILLFALAAQAGWKMLEPPPRALASTLSAPPNPRWVRVWDMGENAFASLWLTLELFSHDEQPGVSLPFKALDYPRVAAWLGAAQALDPGNHNPLLAASQVYSQVPDPARKRIMLGWVEQQFLLDPQTRWPYLAHAAIVARHELKDKKLALAYAAQLARVKNAPDWARQMALLLMSDLGETAQARIVLGGLLQSGALRDPNEIAFLLQRTQSAKK